MRSNTPLQPGASENSIAGLRGQPQRARMAQRALDNPDVIQYNQKNWRTPFEPLGMNQNHMKSKALHEAAVLHHGEGELMVKKKIPSMSVTISLIIIAGFVLSGLSSFLSFQMLFKKDVQTTSELISENIYGNI
ncbi:MAG: hypothetical protein RR320_07100, partial [Oscillospiraceae bacterium]